MKATLGVFCGCISLLAVGVLTVVITAPDVDASGTGLLSDAQMAAAFGLCDCNGVELKDECTENGCPGCKNATSCGGSAHVGTGEKHNMCTTGDPNTGFCKKDGEKKLCTARYYCDAEVDAEPGYKCNAALDACIAGNPEDNCILCSKGDEWSSGKTYKQSYKCE